MSVGSNGGWRPLAAACCLPLVKTPLSLGISSTKRLSRGQRWEKEQVNQVLNMMNVD